MSAASTAWNFRIAIWTILAVLLAFGLIWYAVFTANKPASAASPSAVNAPLVREDDHRVTSPIAEKAQLVEFLDFECEFSRNSSTAKSSR